LHYAARLVRASRPQEAGAPALVRQYVRWGAGPRAGQALVLGAKAAAFLAGRAVVAPADLRRVARPVLRHRILPNFAAEADGVTAESLIDALLAHVPPPAAAPGT
jgi:MoxR-like ATPase